MAKEQAPAFQWYPKDWLSDRNVMRLSWAQKGVYIELLSLCWLEKSLPNDAEDLARTIKADSKDVEAVLPLFTETADNTLKHKRLEKERRAQAARRKERSEAGKRGAERRWQSHGSAKKPNGGAINQPMAKRSSSSSTASAGSNASSKSIATTAATGSTPLVRDALRLLQKDE